MRVVDFFHSVVLLITAIVASVNGEYLIAIVLYGLANLVGRNRN